MKKFLKAILGLFSKIREPGIFSKFQLHQFLVLLIPLNRTRKQENVMNQFPESP